MKPLKQEFIEKNYTALTIGIYEFLKNNYQGEVNNFYKLAFEIVSDLFYFRKIVKLNTDNLNSFLIKSQVIMFRKCFLLPQIQILNLINIQIDLNLSHLLINFFKQKSNLKQITLHDNKILSDLIINNVLEGLAHVDTLEILNIRENSIYVNCFDNLFKVIKNNYKMSKLELKDNLIDEFSKFTLIFFEKLIDFNHINEVIYENIEIEESIFYEISNYIIKSNLTHLSIRLLNSKLNCDLISNLLLSKNHKLESLDISKSNLGYSFLKNLIKNLYAFKNDNFKSINLGRIYLTLDFSHNFIKFLKNKKINKISFYDNFTELNKEIYIESIFRNTDIIHLTLNKSSISSSNFDFLKYIYFNKTLQTLSLKECGLNDENLYYFSLAFPDLISLKTLDLSYNKLTISSSSHLCEVIISTKSLETLNLSNNWLGFQSLIIIFFAIVHNSSLKYLIYRNNFYDIDYVEKYNIKDIQKCVTSPQNCREKCHLCENKTFISLDISFNFMSEHLIFKLEELIKQLKNLKTIFLNELYESEKNISTTFSDIFRFVYYNNKKDNFQKIQYSLYIKINDIFSKYKYLKIFH